ncbi:GHKL domain-containing protein [Planctomycetota bacterium]|nr:GHKL domain-containing protein [Planctomycetota bacterium]
MSDQSNKKATEKHRASHGRDVPDNPHPHRPDHEADIEKMSEAGRRLGHELANLLDGSMRCLGLAMRSLDTDPPIDSHQTHDEADTVLQKLRTADGALKEMSRLIHDWMKTPASQQKTISWLTSPPTNSTSTNTDSPLINGAGEIETLGYAIRLITDLHLVECEQLNCDIVTNLDDQSDVLPVGPLLGVIENLVKNAIEAIKTNQSDATKHRIDIAAKTIDKELLLCIEDTAGGKSSDIKFGETTKPTGHGIGLNLCRDIIEALKGEMIVLDGNNGVRFELRLPVRMLAGDTQG